MAYKYDVFISYRHAAFDTKMAKQLQYRLEHYHIPRQIRKSTGHARGFRVFRDKDELPVTDDLGDTLHTALRESAFLVVLCSPRTEESLWIRKEIEYFLETHDRSQVLTVLIEGEPEDVIPDLLSARNENGENTEVAACDYRRSSGRERRRELHRLASAILECPYSALVNRLWKYNMVRLSLSVMAISFVFTMLVYNNYQVSMINEQLTDSLSDVQKMNAELEETNRKLTKENQENLKKESRILSDQSEEAFNKGDRIEALRYALKASSNGAQDVTEAENALWRAAGFYSEEPQIEMKKRFSMTDAGIEDISAGIIEGRECLAVLDSSGECAVWNVQSEEGDYTGKQIFHASLEENVQNGRIFLLETGDVIIAVPDRITIYSVTMQQKVWERQIEYDGGIEDNGFIKCEKIEISPQQDEILWIYSNNTVPYLAICLNLEKRTFVRQLLNEETDPVTGAAAEEQWVFSRRGETGYICTKSSFSAGKTRIDIMMTLPGVNGIKTVPCEIEGNYQFDEDSSFISLDKTVVFAAENTDENCHAVFCYDPDSQKILWQADLGSQYPADEYSPVMFLRENRKTAAVILNNMLCEYDLETGQSEDLIMLPETVIAEGQTQEQMSLMLLSDFSVITWTRDNTMMQLQGTARTGLIEDYERETSEYEPQIYYTDHNLYIYRRSFKSVDCFSIDPDGGETLEDNHPDDTGEYEYSYYPCPTGIAEIRTDKDSREFEIALLKASGETEWIKNVKTVQSDGKLYFSASISGGWLVLIEPVKYTHNCVLHILRTEDGKEEVRTINDCCYSNWPGEDFRITDQWLYYSDLKGVNRVNLSETRTETETVYSWKTAHRNFRDFGDNLFSVSGDDAVVLIRDPESSVNQSSDIWHIVKPGSGEEENSLQFMSPHKKFAAQSWSEDEKIVSREGELSVIWSPDNKQFAIVSENESVIYDCEGLEKGRFRCDAEEDIVGLLDGALYSKYGFRQLHLLKKTAGNDPQMMNHQDYYNESDLTERYGGYIRSYDGNTGHMIEIDSETIGYLDNNIRKLILIDPAELSVKYSIDNVIAIYPESNMIVQVETDKSNRLNCEWKKLYTSDEMKERASSLLSEMEVICSDDF